MNFYNKLNRQVFSCGEYSLVPIRFEDRFDIMKWRNEQMFHLRQNKALTVEEQEHYFNIIVKQLFKEEEPGQILFSYLKGNKCIGYGGLVHINWKDKNAEVSFIMDSTLEADLFSFHWINYLKLIEEVAFSELELHKIFTYAFDVRPHLYPILENSGFINETILKEHCFFDGIMKDVYIHTKINTTLSLRKATSSDLGITFKWATSPDVRRYSYSTNEILFDDHLLWFNQKLSSLDCEYLIFMRGLQPIGSIRLDFNEENKEAIISYLIDPDYHGKGFGKHILMLTEIFMSRQGKEGKLNLVGYVMKENVRSSHLFKKLGYTEFREEDSNFKYVKEI